MTSRNTELEDREPTLVPVDVSHSPVLAALHEEGFDSPWPTQAFADLLSQHTVGGWIAGPDEPVGFILVQTAADESEILTLVVAPAHRRCGIARQLITQAIQQGKSKRTLVFHLEVAEDNTAAIALYEDLGFASTGRRRNYYARPDGAVDALILTKPLDPAIKTLVPTIK